MNKREHYEKTLAKYWKDHPELRSINSKRAAASPERRALQREIGRRVFLRPDFQAKSLKKRIHHPVMKPGPDHHSAKIWKLRSPRGKIYCFQNVSEFIRQNEDLFDPEDVIWVKHKRFLRCRASALRNLHPERKRPFGTWKGWTWVSIHERRFNDGVDLLNRDGQEFGEKIII